MVLRDSPMNLKSQADKDSCKNPAFVDNDIFEEVLSSWHVLTSLEWIQDVLGMPKLKKSLKFSGPDFPQNCDFFAFPGLRKE